MKLLDRFLNYVKIDTMSSEEANQTPSTEKQFDLANVLVKELKELGLKNVELSKECVVTAFLPTNSKKKDYTIGFIAHLDTIPGFSGTNVKPNVIKDYDGSDIKLKNNVVLSVKQFDFLAKLKGKTLITTDGTTVLGADDKAGVAIIMDMLQYFVNNPEIEHTNIKVAFTPDEEIGGGIEKFDINKFGADFAYTVDGEIYDEINFECFNACSAMIHITGLDIHPGSAKNQMINAVDIATEFNQMLPAKEKPMYTDGYEGFNHLCYLKGEVGYADLMYILRNHDENKLNKQKEDFVKIQDKLNKKYGKDVVEVELKDGYRNMASIIKKDPKCIDRATTRMADVGVKARYVPIRGGTDGANLTLRGLNTPNLGTGGYNCHGPYEFACLEEMQKVSEIITEIAKIK